MDSGVNIWELVWGRKPEEKEFKMITTDITKCRFSQFGHHKLLNSFVSYWIRCAESTTLAATKE